MRRILCLISCFCVPSGGAAHGQSVSWFDCGQAGPFVVRADFVLKEPADLLRTLEQLKHDVQSSLNLKPSERPVEVRVFQSQRGYVRYLEKRIPQGSARPALFVKGPDVSWVYVYCRRDFYTHLQHECTHAILHNSLPYLPLWLDEGLAQYFEVPADQRFAKHSNVSRLRRATLLGWKPNLLVLERTRSMEELDISGYRESWAWAHFLLHGPPAARSILVRYLAGIMSGEVVGPMSKWFAAELPNSRRQLVRHFRAGASRWTK